MSETITRPARSYSMAIWTLRNGKEEFRVLLGNKIISRHATERDAMTALYAMRTPQPATTEVNDA